MCLADSIDGKLARPALTVRKGQRLQVEWDGFTVHIDDEVWPDNASAFPLSPNLIDITVKHHALEFLVSSSASDSELQTANHSSAGRTCDRLQFPTRVLARDIQSVRWARAV